jgi:lambda repressor-like predicted transcriptional regulator
MAAHQGDIIERIIRRQGHSISDLAKLTGVNRRSIYNWFLQPRLKPENIIKLGQAIGHDFSEQFPGQFVSEDFIALERSTTPTLEDQKIDVWKEKYIDLLERYSLLLRISKGDVQIPNMEGQTNGSTVNRQGILI